MNMNRLGQLTYLIGFNFVAINGLFFRGWPDGTAVALYWLESIGFTISVGVLVWLHRRLTNKSGHYFGRGTYNKSFLTTSFICILAQIPFLVALLLLFDVGGGVDVRALAQGLAAAAVFLLIWFFSSLAGLRDRPFAWVKQTTDFALWRIFVVFIAIFIGGFGGAVLNKPNTLVFAFAALRLFTDIVVQLPEWLPEKLERWIGRMSSPGIEDSWQGRRTRERSFAVEHEIPLPR